MAELDISGFVTPEQQFGGLYKFGETLAAQQAAKRKAQQEADAKKKILNKYVADIDAKDYLTGTPEDPVITQKIFDAKNDAYKFVLENPGADQADLEYHVNNLVKDVAVASQNLKQTKLQADKYYESLKDNKSIDKQKFYGNFMKNAYYDENGNLKDISKVDPSQDFLTPTLNSDIYTTEGFNDEIGKFANNKITKDITLRNKSGVTRTANLTIDTPMFYEPDIDEKGVLSEDQKFRPRHGFATENGQRIQVPKTDLQGNAILDANGKPVMEDMKIAQDDAWNFFTSNPQTKGYLNVKMQQYAKDNNLPVTSTQVDNYGRNVLYNIMKENPYVKGSYLENKKELQPKYTFNMGGGAGDAEQRIKDEYTKLSDYLKVGQERNDKISDLLSQGKSDKEIISLVPQASQSTINRIKKGGTKTYGAPFTELRSPVQVDIIQKINASRPKESDKYSAKDVYISTDENGQINVYSAKEDEMGMKLMPLDYTSLNIGVKQPGKKEQQEVIRIGNKKEKSKKNTDPLGLGL
jgi:hypothetical protein